LTKEDLNDLRLLNEALEDAMTVMERLREPDHLGEGLDRLASITSAITVANWVYAVYDAKRLGAALEGSARAYLRNAERPH
jgi:hypothetical protein